jgi:uncharacterized hydrophobic protein (TIGR00271 family)
VIRQSLNRLLRVDAEAKPRLYSLLYEAAEFSCASYISDLIFAAAIATLGLVLNSPAVVIGAMLISPLMGPILAAGLSFAASDIYLGVKSFVNLFGSILTAVLFSAALVWILPFQSPTSEILARTQPNLLDLGVAVSSGLAGSYVMARSLSGGGAGALPGVAIAVALMPPLCTVGFGIGSGWKWQIISGASLLFITNLVAIATSAFLVFYILGMDAPEIRAAVTEADRRHATGNRLYSFLHDTVLGKMFGEVGQLRWRLLMLVITFIVLFVPLRSSLLQLRDETLSRNAARDAVRSLASPDQLLSQQLEIHPDHLIQRLVTTAFIDKQKIAAAEAELTRRTGRHASIQVRQVANEDELISLREQLRAIPMAPPEPTSALELATKLRPLLEVPVQQVWPADNAKLLATEFGFNEAGFFVRLPYNSRRPLDPAVGETITRAVRKTVNDDKLDVVLDWKGPARP